MFVVLFSRGMRRIGGPLGDVVAAADRAGAGDLTVRVREAGPPFLRSIAHAFNTMIARLQRQDDLRRQLMADVAHELRTPLSVMQGRLEGNLDGVYGRDDAQLKEVLEDAQLLSRLVVTYFLVPSRDVDLGDPESANRFVHSFVLPAFAQSEKGA